MTEDQAKAERKELSELLRREAFFRERIVLSSGKESDYYFDARRVTLSARGAYLCGRRILAMITAEEVDAVGGPTLGADPFLGALAVLSVQAGRPLDTFIIRKTAKAHGRRRQVEGPDLKPGMKVILLDDVATTGKAFLQALDVLEPLDVEVVSAVCLIDRQEGAAEALAARGCPLRALFTAREFLEEDGR